MLIPFEKGNVSLYFIKHTHTHTTYIYICTAQAVPGVSEMLRSWRRCVQARGERRGSEL